MTRPASVDALFAGHSLPRTAKALDQIREHITRLGAVVWGRKTMNNRAGVKAESLPSCPYLNAVRRWWRRTQE